MQAVALSQRENNLAVVAKPRTPASRNKPVFEARFVCHASELYAAQLLRAKVFGDEYGVTFGTVLNAKGRPRAIDCDALDAFCEHINVYDTANKKLIATTRVLTSEQAIKAGGFYSAQEFDVTALGALRGRVLEIGRTCVHPDYRSGAAIVVLWSALSDYFLRENFSYLIGCASISLRDGGHNFAAAMPILRNQYFSDESLRVIPRRHLNIDALADSNAAVLPPLLKAYLRMGCKIGGEACWDPAFNCADVFIFLDIAALSARYAQRFLKAG